MTNRRGCAMRIMIRTADPPLSRGDCAAWYYASKAPSPCAITSNPTRRHERHKANTLCCDRTPLFDSISGLSGVRKDRHNLKARGMSRPFQRSLLRTRPSLLMMRKRKNRRWLGNLDSNQDKQSQSLLCYRYTIPQRISEQFQAFG